MASECADALDSLSDNPPEPRFSVDDFEACFDLQARLLQIVFSLSIWSCQTLIPFSGQQSASLPYLRSILGGLMSLASFKALSPVKIRTEKSQREKLSSDSIH